MLYVLQLLAGSFSQNHHDIDSLASDYGTLAYNSSKLAGENFKFGYLGLFLPMC